MNDFGLWALGSRCYEQLKVVDDMNNSRLSAQSSRCFEQHKLVDDKNNLRSYELRSLDSMNILRLGMIWMILGRELKALDALKSSRL